MSEQRGTQEDPTGTYCPHGWHFQNPEPCPGCRSRQREALGGTPGICRALNPDRTFMCDLDAGHDGDHHGFELPTVTLSEVA